MTRNGSRQMVDVYSLLLSGSLSTFRVNFCLWPVTEAEEGGSRKTRVRPVDKGQYQAEGDGEIERERLSRGKQAAFKTRRDFVGFMDRKE